MARSTSSRPRKTGRKPWTGGHSCGGENAHTAWLTVLPLSVAVLFLCAGAGTLIVFDYTVGGTIYDIAAQGYSTTGNDGMNNPQFAYVVPTSWQFPVTGIPLLLLFHLIVGVLLVIYVATLIGFSYYFRKKSNVGIGHPGKSPEGFGIAALHSVFWLASSILIIVDLAMIVLAKTRGQDLIPGLLGYFLIVVGFFLCTTWSVMLFYRPPDVLRHGNDRYESGGGCFAGCYCDRT